MIDPSDFAGRPIRSLQTMLRVLAATDNRYRDLVPDGVYGEQTAAAVSQFQRVNGLPVTAVTDHETWNRIVDAFTRQSPSVLPAAPLSIIWKPKQVIHPGEKNSHLYLIQSMLLAVSRLYPAMPVAQVTGEHDAASVAATNWLQEKSGLPSGGVIDQTTWLYLSKLYRISAGDGTEGGSGSGIENNT